MACTSNANIYKKKILIEHLKYLRLFLFELQQNISTYYFQKLIFRKKVPVFSITY